MVNKPATLKDVAAHAGVGLVTVSVILNGSRSATRVSPATRQRILDAASALNYRRHAVAASLVRRKSDVISFYCQDSYFSSYNMFLSTIMGGIQETCDKYGKDLLVHGIFPNRSVADIYDNLASGKTDGLILHVQPDAPLLAHVIAGTLPAIVLADPHPDLPSVVIDDRAGSTLLVQHLAELGHRRVLYRQSPWPHVSATRRFEAFVEAAGDAGIELIGVQPKQHWGTVSEAEMALLTTGNIAGRPTATVCWNDGFAQFAYTTYKKYGLQAPGDVALVGFDGLPLPMSPAYDLTTIRAPWRTVAETATRLLQQQIETGEAPPKETVLPVTLHVGDTT